MVPFDFKYRSSGVALNPSNLLDRPKFSRFSLTEPVFNLILQLTYVESI